MSPHTKGIVLTGMRTTGELHLGHYVGALENWKAIQDANQHECFLLLADLQALTTHAHSPQLLQKSVLDVALDWLSVGLDPEKNQGINFVLQSQVQGRSDLSMYFQMIARYSEVMRNPTLKAELEGQENATMGFLTYPVDQVADIHMVDALDGRQLLVPVGQDQVPHLEYSRELARRMNFLYGTNLQPCEAMVGDIGRLVGTDGNDKMSKSKGNAINLNDSPDEVRHKVKKMYSLPRASMKDPGNPDQSIVFQYLRAFDFDQAAVDYLADQYRHGGLGDAVIKTRLTDALNTFLYPIRIRREMYASDLSFVRALIMDGTDSAGKICAGVVEHVRKGMSLGF